MTYGYLKPPACSTEYVPRIFGKRKAKSKLCKTKKDRRREGKPACKGERVRTMAWLGREE